MDRTAHLFTQGECRIRMHERVCVGLAGNDFHRRATSSATYHLGVQFPASRFASPGSNSHLVHTNCPQCANSSASISPRATSTKVRKPFNVHLAGAIFSDPSPPQMETPDHPAAGFPHLHCDHMNRPCVRRRDHVAY